MADADRKPVVSIDPRYLLTAEVVERAPAERSKHDTIEGAKDFNVKRPGPTGGAI